MSYFSRLSLRGRLICLVLLAALPLLGLTLYAASEDHRMEKLQVEANTLRVTRLAAGDIAQVIEGARQLLIGLAELPEVRQENSAVCSELFSHLLNQYPYYVNLGTIDSDGNIISSGLKSEAPINLSHHAYVRRAFATRSFVISGYQIEAITGTPVMNFVHPVLNGSGPVKSAVFASLDLGWFRKLELETQLPLGAELLVLDYNGAVLARYPFARKWVGELMPAELVILAAMGEGQESLVRVAGLDSTKRLYGITTIRAAYETDLYVSLGVSEEAVLNRLSWLYIRSIAGVGAVTVLALLAAWFGGEVFILRTVKKLVNATRQLASGDLTVRIGPLKEKDELSMLAGSFDDMAESLEQRTRQAQRAETWYRTLVEQIPMITYIAPQDRAKGFLYVSPQIEMILGFSPDEWIQDPELWMKQLHHGDCERVLANVNESYPKIVDAGFICEYRIRAKGGRVVWLREEAILVQDELDQPFLQGIMLDITQSKHAEEQLKNSHEQLRGFAEHIEAVREEERTWIAREIHDELGQVLTGLKIDISWLDKKLTSVCSGDSNHVLSKRTRSMKDLIDSTIQSVRKISTKLRPGILNDLGLLAAVEWQATEYQTRMGIKFEVTSNIDGIELDERRSSAVFRIFQELMTNIARHANATKVSINLKERDGYLILKVRDNGRGITEQESDNVKSLGILGMRERALLLGGKFSITGMPGQGTRATVKIPIT
ncbi:MAG: cache domain-containing protein [Syntrophobacteraceae bacterium]|jgi:PAS domain S-box-containing protein